MSQPRHVQFTTLKKITDLGSGPFPLFKRSQKKKEETVLSLFFSRGLRIFEGTNLFIRYNKFLL